MRQGFPRKGYAIKLRGADPPIGQGLVNHRQRQTLPNIADPGNRRLAEAGRFGGRRSQ